MKEVLSKSGTVDVSWGAEPEAGDARVFLWNAPSVPHSPPAITVTLTAVPGLTAVWLDAGDKRTGEKLWPVLQRSCGIGR